MSKEINEIQQFCQNASNKINEFDLNEWTINTNNTIVFFLIYIIDVLQ